MEPYRNVELEFQGPENGKLILLAWKRPDLLSNGYVLFYRDDLPHRNFQDFKDRVKLRNPQMKNMSVVSSWKTQETEGKKPLRSSMKSG